MGEVDRSQTRVLVADDDAVFVHLMGGILKKLGCVVVICRNGKEAIAKVREHAFDICFMDIMMPEMNGVEAAQVIREELTIVMPIIAITSSGMTATQEKCKDVGMTGFIVKPVSFEGIKEAIEQYALKRP